MFLQRFDTMNHSHKLLGPVKLKLVNKKKNLYKIIINFDTKLEYFVICLRVNNCCQTFMFFVFLASINMLNKKRLTN